MSSSTETEHQDVEAQTAAASSQSAPVSQASAKWHLPWKKSDWPTVEPIENGYREIAQLMACKDSPFAIFRRFGQLNMLNLLCLQAELMELQRDLKDACAEDDKMGIGSKRGTFAYSFIAMREGYEDYKRSTGEHTSLNGSGNGQVLPPEPPETTQYGLMLEVREKLKEYSN